MTVWKWVLGAIGAVIVLVAVGVCFGMRKMSNMASGTGEQTTMIAATPARVFASLAHGDSIPDWMAMAGRVRVTRHGILHVGDTLHVDQRGTEDSSRRLHWIVSQSTPPKVFEVQMRNDSSGIVLVVRRFALEPRGDSTALVSTVVSPLLDSTTAANARAKEVGAGRAMMGMTLKMMVGGTRLQSQMEVNMLKMRIEGAPAARPGGVATP
jgi:uncharacterized protein YndB with AHSA1/START domain